MALSHFQPRDHADDLVTCTMAAKLFAETPFPVSRNTLARWTKELELKRTKVGKEVYVSYSDLLDAHADWVGGKPVP